jgi:hypothetical protein
MKPGRLNVYNRQYRPPNATKFVRKRGNMVFGGQIKEFKLYFDHRNKKITLMPPFSIDYKKISSEICDIIARHAKLPEPSHDDMVSDVQEYIEGKFDHLIRRNFSEAKHDVAGESKPVIVLSEEDFLMFKRLAKENPWISKRKGGKLSPSEYIREMFGDLFERGLTRAHIANLEGTLDNAYAKEIHAHPERRIKKLVQNPHTAPAGAPRSVSTRVVADQSPEQQIERRQKSKHYKAQQRARAQPQLD